VRKRLPIEVIAVLYSVFDRLVQKRLVFSISIGPLLMACKSIVPGRLSQNFVVILNHLGQAIQVRRSLKFRGRGGDILMQMVRYLLHLLDRHYPNETRRQSRHSEPQKQLRAYIHCVAPLVLIMYKALFDLNPSAIIVFIGQYVWQD
jgi:hypothetical protein